MELERGSLINVARSGCADFRVVLENGIRLVFGEVIEIARN